MMIATICLYGLVLESVLVLEAVLIKFPALYLVLKVPYSQKINDH